MGDGEGVGAFIDTHIPLTRLERHRSVTCGPHLMLWRRAAARVETGLPAMKAGLKEAVRDAMVKNEEKSGEYIFAPCATLVTIKDRYPARRESDPPKKN
jgi:hypothetical protein